MALLICKDVSLGYEGINVVKNINFKIESGDYLYILGENGSGKSTLVKSLLGLKQPSSGSVISELNPTQIGYLPQQADAQKDFPASVFEVVLSGCLNHVRRRPFYSADDKALALSKMKLMDILGLKNKCYQELSGGQQQRVLLSRALCAAKKLILLDEPVSGLDPIVTGELYSLIEKINKEEKMTVVMVSHDINAALKYADHILHIGQDKIFFGTKDEYITSRTGKEFLGGNN